MILYNSLKQGRLQINERHVRETKSSASPVGPKFGASRCHAARIFGQPRATLWQGDMQMPTKRVAWTLHLSDNWAEKWRESVGLCPDRTSRHCQTSCGGVDNHRCCAGGNFGHQRRIAKAQGVVLNDYHQLSKRNCDDYRQYGRSVSGGS